MNSDDIICCYYNNLPILSWEMDIETLSCVRKLQDANGEYLWEADLTPGGFDRGTLFKIPINVVKEKCCHLKLQMMDGEIKIYNVEVQC